MEAALVGLIATVIGGALSAYVSQIRQRGEPREESPQARADRLSRALREAVEVIEEFQTEIRQGKQTADRLQQDIERYKEIARLHRDDVDAVARVLRTELRQESGRSLKQQIAMNGGFVLLGAGLSLLLTALTGIG